MYKRKLKSYLDDDEFKAKRVKTSLEYHNNYSGYAKYQPKVAKACIVLQSAKAHIFYHNTRDEQSKFEAKYTFKEFEKFNEYSCSVSEANEKFKSYLDEACKNYYERTKQRIQNIYKDEKKTKLDYEKLRVSAVLTLNENHNLEDLEKLALKIEQIYGLRTLQIAVHRDEGHFKKDEFGNVLKDENGDLIFDPNLHAHIEFFTLDKNGIYRYKKQDRYKIHKELQSLVASELGMQRGKDYAALKEKKPQHLGGREYAKKMIEKEQQNALRAKEKAELESLKELNKELRAKLEINKAQRSDYAKLEQEIKELKEKIKKHELNENELESFKEQKEREIKELKSKNEALINEKEVLKNENIELKDKNIKLKDENIENLNLSIFAQLAFSTLQNSVYYSVTNLDSSQKRSEFQNAINEFAGNMASELNNLCNQKESKEPKELEMIIQRNKPKELERYRSKDIERA